MLSRFLGKGFSKELSKVLYRHDGYGRLGALRDDLYRESDLINEAVRRLPKKVQDERHFRIIRCFQLDIQHSLLPESEWTPFEADHDYLEPYIKEVEAEEAEKKAWYKTH